MWSRVRPPHHTVELNFKSYFDEVSYCKIFLSVFFLWFSIVPYSQVQVKKQTKKNKLLVSG